MAGAAGRARGLEAVADHHQGVEAEPSTTFHNRRASSDGDDAFAPLAISVSFTLPSTTFLPLAANDNGVTQLVFTNTSYAGSATLTPMAEGVLPV
mgnify:CR=1 FL=1